MNRPFVSTVGGAVAVAVVLVFATPLLTGCGGDGIGFFEVVRTRLEECAIRSNGEFCVEPEQFDPPVVEVWSVDVRSDTAVLYLEEEVWILDDLPDGADQATTPRTATKTSVVIDGATGCRTDGARTVSFLSEISTSAFGTSGFLEGSVTSRSVLTGPASCGSTPVGERTVDDVVGQVSGP